MDDSSLYASSSGIDKATALLLGLGVELSSKVLQYLTEGEMERVLLALGQTGSIAPEIRRTAFQEAYEYSLADSSMRGGGIEYSRQLLSRAVGPRRGADPPQWRPRSRQSEALRSRYNNDMMLSI